jgi:hypothetical protein
MATLAARRRPLEAEHAFFTGASLVMIAVIAFGFAPSFYMRGIVARRYPIEALNGLVVLHGVLFTTWLLLFALQTWLVAAGRLDLHRRLGRAGFVLLPVLAVVATVTALGGTARPLTAPEGIGSLSWLAVPLLDVPVFTGLIALGLANRARPQAHKRYLYIAMADMMAPGFGRMPLPVPPALHGPVATIALPGLFLVALVAWDIYAFGRPKPVTVGASLAAVCVWVLKPAIWSTPAWLGFAAWVSAPFR